MRRRGVIQEEEERERKDGEAHKEQESADHQVRSLSF
jgi:hypothetical protein